MICQLSSATNVSQRIEAPGRLQLTTVDALNSMVTMPKPPKAKTKNPADRSHQTMGINLPIDIWQLLHRVALARALKGGGRTSISALLVDLVQRHRKELEKELNG